MNLSELFDEEKLYKFLSGEKKISLFIIDRDKRILWKSNEDEFPVDELPADCGSFCYRVIKGGEKNSFVLSKINPEIGEAFEVEDFNEKVFAITIIPLGGEKLGVLKQDITYFKKFQEDQFYKYNLNVVTNLAAGIAHEVNNPLTVIQGLTELYLRNDKSFSREDMEKILKMCSRIKMSISHFMGYFDSTFFEKVECKVYDLIDRAVKLYKSYVKCEKIDVEIQGNKELAIKVEEKLVINSILNILNNVGELLKGLKGGKIFIDFNRLNDDISIFFRIDAGRDKSMELKELIFPYSNFDCKTESMGCGLLIAYWSIKKIGGNLKILKEKNSIKIDLSFPVIK